jgi:hypothetical protein
VCRACLGPNVAKLDAGQRSVRLQAAELEDEWVRAIVLAVQEQPRHQHTVRGRLAQAPAANPPPCIGHQSQHPHCAAPVRVCANVRWPAKREGRLLSLSRALWLKDGLGRRTLATT